MRSIRIAGQLVTCRMCLIYRCFCQYDIKGSDHPASELRASSPSCVTNFA